MSVDHARMWSRQQARGDLADRYWALLGARPGWRIAEVGCGPGYFALRYALLTGPTGHVHATDADPDALAFLLGKLDAFGHANVTTELLDIERAPLPALHFDAVVCTDVLHHVRDLRAALKHMRASGPRLLVAEFDPEGPGDIGPPKDERLDPDELVQALRDADWKPGPVVALTHEHFAIVSR